MQLDAQLSERNVSIELTDEARNWLVENGYDETMGARPMARLIQREIKTPLADEVLFGRLKGGGTVRVMVVKDEGGAKKLGFVYPDGPMLPRPEKAVQEASAKPKRKRSPRKKAAKILPKPEPEVSGRSGKGGRGSVPKVPLKT